MIVFGRPKTSRDATNVICVGYFLIVAIFNFQQITKHFKQSKSSYNFLAISLFILYQNGCNTHDTITHATLNLRSQ